MMLKNSLGYIKSLEGSVLNIFRLYNGSHHQQLLILIFSLPRPCELQISDFENAAVCCFVVLLTRSILSYKWNLLMPISKVDENMKRAQMRDAVRTQKFWWRTDIFTVCEESKV